MAAEHVFYGENSNGVGGDLQSATAAAAYMVGASGDGARADRAQRRSSTTRREEETRERIMKRFEKIGLQIMNRTGGGGRSSRPDRGVLSDRVQAAMAAQIIGQAYITRVPSDRGEQGRRRADRRRADREGRDVRRRAVDCSTRQNLTKPEIDLTQEETWPQI